MNKVVITYTDPEGEKRKVEVVGDFKVGRQKTERGPMIVFLLEKGETQCLTNCPRTISRLQEDVGRECRSCHARFYWEEERFYVQDMGSTNGTMYNGKFLSGWEKKRESDPVEISTSSEIRLGDFDMVVDPIIERSEPNPIIKQLGLDPVLGQSSGNGSGPIIINIQNLDAGTHKNIGSIDVVANRSKVDIDGDDDERDIVSNKSGVRKSSEKGIRNPGRKRKRKYGEIEFDEDM